MTALLLAAESDPSPTTCYLQMIGKQRKKYREALGYLVFWHLAVATGNGRSEESDDQKLSEGGHLQTKERTSCTPSVAVKSLG